MTYIGFPGTKDRMAMIFKKRLPASIIEQTVCDYYGLRTITLLVKSRRADFLLCRHMTIYLVKEYGGIGWSEMGRRYKRHHAAVIHARKSIQDRLDTEEAIRKQKKEIEMLLFS